MLVLPLISYLLLLSACGFEPMYGGSTQNAYGDVSNENELSQIYISNIPDESGQYLRNALIDRFYRHGRPTHPDFTLYVAPLQERETNLDLTVESETTRAQLRIQTEIRLMESGGTKPVLTRQIRGFNSYNVLGSQFTTIVSEDDARKAILDDLARQIERELILYFGRTQ